MSKLTREENEKFLRSMRAGNFTTGLDRELLLLDEVDELRAKLAKANASRDAYEAEMKREIGLEHWSLPERALLRKTLKWFHKHFVSLAY